MKHNAAEVLQLEPDYLGFIFYEKSPRDVSKHSISDLALPLQDGHTNTKRVGVFVNASVDYILDKCVAFQLDVIQLHGDESAAFCNQLRTALKTLKKEVKLWKVFGIKDNFNFNRLTAYEPYIDAFLFDTKGKERGGNGYTFNWKVLEGYTSTTPIILSGGIGPSHIKDLQDILQSSLPIYAIDINSKFEDQPGKKNIEKLSAFINATASLRK